MIAALSLASFAGTILATSTPKESSRVDLAIDYSDLGLSARRVEPQFPQLHEGLVDSVIQCRTVCIGCCGDMCSKVSEVIDNFYGTFNVLPRGFTNPFFTWGWLEQV